MKKLDKMLFFHNNNYSKSAIYEIRNRLTNRSYIGQTAHVRNRWYDYKYTLPKSKNHNQFLQNDFNKCFEQLGHHDFIEFHILESCDNLTQEERFSIEEDWIKNYINEGYILYNIDLEPTKNKSFWSDNSKKAGKKYGRKKGHKHSEETKNKMSKSQKGHLVSLATRQKLHDFNIGKPSLGKGFKRLKSTGMKHHHAKIYTNLNLISPTEESFTRIECLASFCKVHGLLSSNLLKVLNGKRNQHKGWRLVNEN